MKEKFILLSGSCTLDLPIISEHIATIDKRESFKLKV